jgi:hypothetical protein
MPAEERDTGPIQEAPLFEHRRPSDARRAENEEVEEIIHIMSPDLFESKQTLLPSRMLKYDNEVNAVVHERVPFLAPCDK